MRRPERLREALTALDFIARSNDEAPLSSAATEATSTAAAGAHKGVQRLRHQLERLLTVDTSAASAQALAQGLRGPAVGQFIRQVQEDALTRI
jgi:hypothetical protein